MAKGKHRVKRRNEKRGNALERLPRTDEMPDTWAKPIELNPVTQKPRKPKSPRNAGRRRHR